MDKIVWQKKAIYSGNTLVWGPIFLYGCGKKNALAIIEIMIILFYDYSWTGKSVGFIEQNSESKFSFRCYKKIFK